MKSDQIEGIAGAALMMLISGWAVLSLSHALWCNLSKGMSVDRTQREVTKEDAPGMFWLQIAGFIVLIAVAFVLGIWASIGLLLQIVGTG